MIAAIYIRKSREDKNKPSHRLNVQRQQLPEHAKAQGWVPHIYDDGHASAARGKAEDLKERARLEADIRSGKINIILTIELSRLSRDDSMQDYTAWLHLCGEHKVKLATLSRILDPAQHSDWMLLLMEGGFSSVEMKIMQARMKEGRAEAFRAGKYLSGRPPMPYRYDKQLGGLVVDPDQIDDFKQVIDLAHNHSAMSIAKTMRLPHTRIRRIIADDRLLFYRGKRIDPDTGEEIDGQWPAVITEEQAIAIRKNRRAGHRNPRRKITGMLSNLGLVICKYCGRSVRSWANGKPRKDGVKLQYYGCRHLDKKGNCPQARMVPQHIIDDLVITNLANTLSNIGKLKEFWLNNQEEKRDAGRLEKKLTILRSQKRRLINAITEGVIDFADAKEKRLDIDAAIAEITRQLDQVDSQTETEPTWEMLSFSRAEIDLLTIEEMRELIPSVISNITMSNAKLILAYKFPRHADGRKTAEINLPKPGVGGRKSHWKIK